MFAYTAVMIMMMTMVIIVKYILIGMLLHFQILLLKGGDTKWFSAVFIGKKYICSYNASRKKSLAERMNSTKNLARCNCEVALPYTFDYFVGCRHNIVLHKWFVFVIIIQSI